MRPKWLCMLIVVSATVAIGGSAAPVRAQEADSPSVGLRLVADGFTSPVALVEAQDGSGRLFVVDQAGVIRIISAAGNLLPQPFLDLRSRIVPLMPAFDERGVLGLAFHPRYADNGRFFVYYSAPLRAGAPAGYNHTARVSEFRVSAADANRGDPASERIVLEVDKPQFNHNGGTLLFGPSDGYLYMSIGDGGGANDVGLGHVEDWYAANAGGNGQDIQHNLLGNVLRIDVDRGAPYGVPADNPFAGTPGCIDGCDEIWAYGFRNPYRMSFDQGGARDLFVGDAGHPLIDPVIEYANHHQPGGLGATVIGGHVYRGQALPQFSGRYIFGDWSREFEEPDGSVFVAMPRKKGLWHMEQVRIVTSPTGRVGHYVLGFGQDLAGEMYLLTTDQTGPSGTTGKVYRLVRPRGWLRG